MDNLNQPYVLHTVNNEEPHPKRYISQEFRLICMFGDEVTSNEIQDILRTLNTSRTERLRRLASLPLTYYQSPDGLTFWLKAEDYSYTHAKLIDKWAKKIYTTLLANKNTFDLADFQPSIQKFGTPEYNLLWTATFTRMQDIPSNYPENEMPGFQRLLDNMRGYVLDAIRNEDL